MVLVGRKGRWWCKWFLLVGREGVDANGSYWKW